MQQFSFHALPPTLPTVEVDVPTNVGGPATPLRIPANSPEEAFAMLVTMGEGLGGAGARNLYYGSVIEPIRDAYKAHLETVEREIILKRAALGPKPDPLELRGLAQWAARQRARTARVARLPTPSLMAGLEARDWNKYGVGGRTFENLMRRQGERKGLSGPAAYESVLKSASTSDPKTNASVARAARHLRAGGGVLAVTGLGITAYDIANAPKGERAAIARRTGIGFAGGLIGSEIAVGLVSVGAGLLLGVTPAGWIILGVGLVGGIVGGVVADGIFYPEKAEPIARELGAGIAINPRHPGMGATPLDTNGLASTTLPAIRRVTIAVRAGDTQFTLGERAYRLAAASVGLDARAQEEFANRHASPDGLHWASGDPTPSSGSTSINLRDIALTTGKEVIFNLSETQRDELRAAADRR